MVIQIPDIALNPDAWSYDTFAMLALALLLMFYLFREASNQGVEAWQKAQKGRRKEVQDLRDQNKRLRDKITEYHKDYVRIIDQLQDDS